MPQHNLPMVENLVSVLRLVLPPANFTPAVPLDWSNLQFTNTSLKPIADCVKRPALRACFQTQRVSILPKFCATFWQNFAAVSGILQKILPKNEPKFGQKRNVMGLKTGSKKEPAFFIYKHKNQLMQQNLIENLSRIIARLPGMGPRIAKRIVLHLAANKEKVLSSLIENLSALKEKIYHCEICGNLDEGMICGICLNQNRDQNLICVVEEVADLWAIERAENYRGKYHILGGNLSAISGKTIEDLNLDKLYKRLEKEEVQEVIVATSATIDGQTTAHFLAENLKKFRVKITRLAYGIPVGSELDYLDEGTIAIAFKTRSKL